MCYTFPVGEDEANSAVSNLQDQLAHLRQRMAAALQAPAFEPPFEKDREPLATGTITDWLEGSEIKTAYGAHFESRRIWNS